MTPENDITVKHPIPVGREYENGALKDWELDYIRECVFDTDEEKPWPVQTIAEALHRNYRTVNKHVATFKNELRRQKRSGLRQQQSTESMMDSVLPPEPALLYDDDEPVLPDDTGEPVPRVQVRPPPPPPPKTPEQEAAEISRDTCPRCVVIETVARKLNLTTVDFVKRAFKVLANEEELKDMERRTEEVEKARLAFVNKMITLDDFGKFVLSSLNDKETQDTMILGAVGRLVTSIVTDEFLENLADVVRNVILSGGDYSKLERILSVYTGLPTGELELMRRIMKTVGNAVISAYDALRTASGDVHTVAVCYKTSGVL